MRRVAPETMLTAVGAAEDAFVPSGMGRVPSRGSLPTNLGWAATGLPRSLARMEFDLFHAPAYTAPLWGARPLVVTIHDVSYARHPEWYPYALDPVRRWFYATSARRADRIITDSEFSRGEIVAAYGIDRDRIDVVPLGVSPRFAPAVSRVREPVALHVGDLHARRNVSIALDAVIELRRTVPEARALRLALVGVDRGSLRDLAARAARAGMPDALEFLGILNDDALLDRYQRATMFVYPSRYEGFGLPVLEAMACGVPVVATTAGAVPEVAGSAAVLLDPDDARGWHEAMRRILVDRSFSARLQESARLRALTFDWARTASGTVASYEAALAPRNRFADR
jgi:glycosyltransferase involved in cell wall biosynthesis